MEARTRERTRIALLTGNEAIARGAYEAGVAVATGYPGTPSTEIVEYLATLPDVYVEWSSNEKVALDVAMGASMGGVRALCTMKHVGLNVAADTFMVASYTGVRGGLVVVSADDPGMHSSQNEQDNRLYAKFAGVPLLEPGDSQEAKTFTELAFSLSEEFDTPVLLRTTTRISHTRGVVELGDRHAPPPRPFHRDPAKYVMLPAYARQRRPRVLERLLRLAEVAARPEFLRVEMRDPSVGVVTAGVCYSLVREVVPEASVLKLGMSYPLPLDAIRRFAGQVRRLFVVEELEPFLEEMLRAAGFSVEGKAYFPQQGELTPERVREGFARAGVLPEPGDAGPANLPTAPRPPVLCPGCPHTAPFLALQRLGAVVCGDIGCYTLAALEPLRAMDSCLAMGSSIGMATGLALAGTAPGPVVAVIGDSTFLHAGLPALVDAVYKRAHVTVVILDNGTTAMTGGQPHPATGSGVRGAPAPRVDLAAVCRAMGVEFVRAVDPYDLGATFVALEEAIRYPGVSVVITNRPCVEAPVKVRDEPFRVVLERCTACQLCMDLGCPAIVWTDETYEGRPKVTIRPDACTGCTLCAQVCPADAIVRVGPGWRRS
ncbi:MAG: indolepyruvate ferredoxin oxidoreductase subunit alpha [Armatimonadota bacterium]|nr:indolepyruvate ferredoxin oxidoreductase subunit alpha [Armatimonadota bacterium]MDR7389860.1 indolepyruvate ferredoxin oxidoreductase subunit alpha [Armatimonadota bacterium]MDR7395674.1 indolepyruvate ferredoxin oxidoreductase subunit alpha [Armatimonadota bacterium]MDR7397683.1 indolepyruvate ferredoxin oxidoreductase subunit alpha [Armatimonadota bacterium]MDR7405161.1 indolepyruvate ferredoxin oxidoreductase subunit alpha [Armatimonadota bacterium]